MLSQAFYLLLALGNLHLIPSPALANCYETLGRPWEGLSEANYRPTIMYAPTYDPFTSKGSTRRRGLIIGRRNCQWIH